MRDGMPSVESIVLVCARLAERFATIEQVPRTDSRWPVELPVAEHEGRRHFQPLAGRTGASLLYLLPFHCE